MKLNAGLALPSQQIKGGDVSDKSVDPYIALHHRQSDYSMTTDPEDRKTPSERRTDDQQLLDCFVRVQRKIDPSRQTLGYLAGDTMQTRTRLSEGVDSLRFPQKLDIFHVDKSTLESSTDVQNYRGTLDAWAEQIVLTDSQCLIMSWSMYSFIAYYIRGGQNRCAIFVNDCNQKDLTLEWNNYWFEPGKLTSGLTRSPERMKSN